MEQAILQGNVQALLDEYKKVISQLVRVIEGINDSTLPVIVDPLTDDPACKSIQKILTHVVQAGYNYTVYFENYIGNKTTFFSLSDYSSVKEYINHLNEMYIYCENFFKNNPTLNIVEKDTTRKILVRWGQQYDIEQLMEHAIVHVLRHRRQIEKYI